MGDDLVLHLHRLDHADQVPLGNLGPLLDRDLEHGPLQRRGQRLAGGTRRAAALALALRRALAAGSRHRGAGDGVADHLHVEELARDLDLVVALDLLGLLLLGGGGSRHLRGGRLEPVAILHQVTAGLPLRPLLGGEQRLVEWDQRGQAADFVLRERA